eukprot:TRINITY_DN1377_c0_g1_i1.p1 TRINITY_DN1377_c0_g1~~TRINITY_DN1377_c0_g1_i1.p1  ORF type:complete len:390 (-),score=162.71 TRINITY_DN1377_c0_g1_i1:105-1274(-)
MYHVGVSNIFELLDDENDEGGKRVIPRVTANQEAAPTKGTKPAPAVRDPSQKKTDPFARNQPYVGRNDRSDNNKGERKPRQEGERPPRRPRQEGDRPPRQEGDRPPRRPRQEGERPPRENREPREPREPRQPRDDAPFDRTEQRRDRKEREHGQFVKSQVGEDGAPRKRVYDRKSGTGRGREVKKGGGGAGNWGKDNGDGKYDEKPVAEDIAKIEGEGAEEPASPAVPQETEEQKAKREEEEKKRQEEEEKEAKLMGLEEYNKKRADALSKVGVPELPSARKAGEGVDKKEAQKWATYTLVKKGDEDEEDKQAEGKKKEKKEGKKQAVSADLLNFQAKKPERRDNRDRERDNRNSPKVNPKEQKVPKKRSGPAPDVKDNSNFPALSTKA